MIICVTMENKSFILLLHLLETRTSVFIVQ